VNKETADVNKVVADIVQDAAEWNKGSAEWKKGSVDAVQDVAAIVQETAEYGLSAWKWDFYGGNRRVGSCASSLRLGSCLTNQTW